MTSPLRALGFVLALSVATLRGVDAGEITFTFQYDTSFSTSAGGNATLAQNDFTYVGNYLSSIIKSSVEFDIEMKFTISGSNDPESPELGFAGSNFSATSHAFNKTVTQILAQTGNNLMGTGNPVGYSTFNFGASWGFNGSVGGSQVDFRYVVLHEMTHALGYIGAIDATGGTQFGSGIYGWMDRYMYGWNGSSYQPLVNASPGNYTAMSGAASAVVNSLHPVQFRGPNVLAYLNNSTGQDMYTPGTFSDGSSIYHENNPGALMYYAIGNGPKTIAYSGLQVAFLRDLGYTVVPEPGAYALAGIAVIVLGVFGNSRKARSKPKIDA